VVMVVVVVESNLIPDDESPLGIPDLAAAGAPARHTHAEQSDNNSDNAENCHGEM
jgi:hypothetical protein